MLNFRTGLAALSLAAIGPPALAAPVCLQAYRIESTEVPDDSTILFKMNNHEVYRATMVGKCTGLAMDSRGFSYEPIPGSDEICANLFSIRLNTYHSVCLVGAIERISGGHG